MRVFFITQEEPFYLPEFFKSVLSKNSHQFIGMTILKPAAPKQGMVRFIYEHFLFYGPLNFIIHSFLFVYYKFMNMISHVVKTEKNYSVRKTALRYGVEVYETKNINGREFLETLGNLALDIVVSVASSQVFKKNILSLPTKGCINVHGAPLPRYRGKLPSFWALANREKETAVTVHYMDEKLDNGKIIIQKFFKIDDNDTLDSLIKKSKRIAAEALVGALKQIEDGTAQVKENDASKATYFSFPTKNDVRRFLSEGRRFR